MGILIFISVLVFLLGMSWGSFVNMLEYRVAVGYGVQTHPNPSLEKGGQKRSFCDWCGEKLNWYDNIPLFSWLFLKGKSRCCGNPLPYSYPLIELILGVIFVIIFWVNFGNWFQIVFLMLISVFLVFSFIFDLKYMILPDFSTIILVILVVGFVIGRPLESPLQQHILAAVGSTLFLGVLYLITKGKGMGLGDVKLAIFIGLFLGYKAVVAYYVAFLTGAVLGGGLMLLNKVKKTTPIPFGPFLILGVVVAYWWGEKIIFWMQGFM